MSVQRPGDTIPHQQDTEDVIDQRLEVALSAGSGSGGFLPDYANLAYRDIEPSIGGSGIFATQVLTPLTAGWVLLRVQADLRLAAGADESVSIEIAADPDDAYYLLDFFQVVAVVDSAPSRTWMQLHGLVPAGMTYGVRTTASAGSVINVQEIVEIPALA